MVIMAKIDAIGCARSGVKVLSCMIVHGDLLLNVEHSARSRIIGGMVKRGILVYFQLQIGKFTAIERMLKMPCNC